MSEKRYELIWDSTVERYQIRALVLIPDFFVYAGQLGGWVDSEENLPQSGTGWVEEGSTLCGDTVVHHAYISGNSIIQDCKIYARGTIYSSKLKYCHFFNPNEKEESVIQLSSCTMSRVVSHAKELGFSFCRIYAKKSFQIEKNINIWKHVEINCKTGLVEENILGKPSEGTRLENSHIICKSFEIRNSQLHFADLNADNALIFHDSFFAPMEHIESFMTYKGKELKASQTTSSGSPQLRGQLILKHCELNGYPTLELNGRLKHVKMSDFSKIESSSTDVKKLSRLDLKEDEHFVVK